MSFQLTLAPKVRSHYLRLHKKRPKAAAIDSVMVSSDSVVISKGQETSEVNCGVFKYSKKFPGFCPNA